MVASRRCCAACALLAVAGRLGDAVARDLQVLICGQEAPRYLAGDRLRPTGDHDRDLVAGQVPDLLAGWVAAANLDAIRAGATSAPATVPGRPARAGRRRRRTGPL